MVIEFLSWYFDRWVFSLVCIAIGFGISTLFLALRLYIIKRPLNSYLAAGIGVFSWLLTFLLGFFILASVLRFPDPSPFKFSWLLSLATGIQSWFWLTSPKDAIGSDE